MGFLDSILGRSKPKQADLDALFAVPPAALTLEAGGGFTATGTGSVCFRATEGAAFAQTAGDVVELLDMDAGAPVEQTSDSYGFTWLLCHHQPGDIAGLVTDLHAINTGLQDNGFGPSLLCSIVNFTDAEGKALGLVYLYKRGTFYPFAPRGRDQRDNLAELRVRDLVAEDLPLEKDLERWLALHGAPGLS